MRVEWHYVVAIFIALAIIVWHGETYLDCKAAGGELVRVDFSPWYRCVKPVEDLK